MPLADLVRTLCDHHHPALRAAVPAVLSHLRTAVAAARDRPEIPMVEDTFTSMIDALLPHLDREQYLVFPFIVDLADAVEKGLPVPRGPFATLAHPARMLEDEHQTALTGLGRLHDLTRGYTPPPEPPPAVRECYAALAAFDALLREHIRLTDHELLPTALELEERLQIG